VYRHKLGTDTSEDVLIFHEKDDTFDVNVFKTKSLEYIFIASSSTISDEHRFIPSDNVFADWTIIQPRIDDLEYSVEHYEDEFYIITNADDAFNFKIVKTKIDNCGMENWVDVIPHRPKFCWKVLKSLKTIWFLKKEKKDCYN
jgi:oligopeptidase B